MRPAGLWARLRHDFGTTESTAVAPREARQGGGSVSAARSPIGKKPPDICESSAMAALSVCEALALALAEEGILSKEGLCVAIDDAVAAHREAARLDSNPLAHSRAAALAEGIRKSVEAALQAKHRG
jgi:hypothetical protein